MFCSQCGKKILDSMLFCPFCGAAIVIPDQDNTTVQQPSDESVHEPETSKMASPQTTEHFVPLDLNIDWSGEDVVPEPKGEAVQDDFESLDLSELEAIPPVSPEFHRGPAEEVSEGLSGRLQDEPVKLQGRVPDLTHIQPPKQKGGSGRKPATYAPAREFNPNDIFLDGGDHDDYDDRDDDRYSYEEPEEGGFWIRHIRGVVALSLMLIVVAIVAGWAFSSAGQTALARADLAWNPGVYAELAYDAYKNKNYLLSANYYERALARDTDSYTYANSAGVAYYLAGDTVRAAEMGRRAIEIDPSRGDAYQLLLRLYPDAGTRPWEISTLIQQGYQLTGDESLKLE